MTLRKKKITKESIDLSIILPAFNAEKTIFSNLSRIKEVLDRMNLNYELICVVDGKADNTMKNAKKFSKKYRNVKVIGYLTNLGKGHAVRYGMARARGEIIGFIDAGDELNPNALPILLEQMKWYEADIVIGSKRHQASRVYYSWQRRIISIGYQMVVRLLFGLKVKDTQVGMKLFRREVLQKVLPRILVKAYAFDIEMLSVANYLGFGRIYEGPVELKLSFGGSTIIKKGFIRTVINMFWDTIAVFYRMRILKYYDYKNRKNWITPNYLTLSKS